MNRLDGIKPATLAAGPALLLGPAGASSCGALTFEIGIEDCHTSGITRTCKWNHSGTPPISEDANPPNPGFHFLYRTNGGDIVGQSANFDFTVIVNRALVAQFETELRLTEAPGGEFMIEWPIDPPGWILEANPIPAPDSWQGTTRPGSDIGGMLRVTVDPAVDGSAFFRITGL